MKDQNSVVKSGKRTWADDGRPPMTEFQQEMYFADLLQQVGEILSLYGTGNKDRNKTGKVQSKARSRKGGRI